MTRRQNTDDHQLDPTVAAELDALERALNGDAGADPLLAELIRETRADAPRFDGPARESLDAKVAAGFPKEPNGAGFLARLKPSGPMFRPALAVMAVAVVGFAVTSTALNNEGTTTRDSARSAPSSVDNAESAAGGATADVAAEPNAAAAPEPSFDDSVTRGATRQSAPAMTVPAPPSGGDQVGNLSGKRRVERSAELSLTAKPENVQGVSNDVIRTVQAAGGVVAASRISTAEDGGEAFFDLRIPTSKLDRTLAQLSKLASVTGLTQDSSDITGSFVSASDRLQDAKDERAALLKALGKATTDRQVNSLRARIADSRTRIASAQAEVQRLKNRTDKSTVALTITGDPSAGDKAGSDEDEGGAWTPGDAAGDAWRVLEVAAGVAVIAAAAFVPLALLALLAYGAARITRRRGRERALDATA